jgi:hypothetical protein
MAAISDPIGQGATGNSASGAELDKVYGAMALLQSASSLVSQELTCVPARGAHMTKMVARKSVVFGHREDLVVMVDSDLSESTGHHGEENMPTQAMRRRGRGGEVPCRQNWLVIKLLVSTH